MDSINLTKSLAKIENLYGQAKFDDAAKLGFLRIAFKDVEPLRGFVVAQAANNYDTLCKGIKDYESIQKFFCILGASIDGISTQDDLEQQGIAEPRLLIRPDVRVKNMESKIYWWTNQIANITVMVKKNPSSAGEEKKKGSWKDRDYDIVC